MVFDYFRLPILQNSGALAQMPASGLATPEAAALVFSGPQFFVALLSGLILAFGFQMLLTNFSVATGLSYLTRGDSDDDSGSGLSFKRVTLGLGLWTLVTVSLALFFACLLAVRLSLFSSPLMGAITGLVIWGTYFSLMVWLSSTTVGSLIGSVVSSATSSFQAIMGTATSALGAKSFSNQVVATAEAAAAAVRHELASGLDAEDVKENLHSYIAGLRAPQLNAESLEAEVKRLVSEASFTELGDGQDLSGFVNRETFVELAESRTDLSKQEARQLGDRLYRAWKTSLQEQGNHNVMQELLDYFKSSKPEQLLYENMGDRLDQILKELKRNRSRDSNASDGPNNDSDRDSRRNSGHKSSAGKGLMSQAFSMASSALLSRVDLSDLDLQTVLDRLDKARHQVIGTAEGLSTQLSDATGAPNVTKIDVEAFLTNAYPWQLKQANLEQTFRQVLYDDDASPTALRENLSQLNRNQFRETLAARGLFTQDELRSICNRLENVRCAALKAAATAEQVQAEKSLRLRLETFLQFTPREELLSPLGDKAFEALVEDDAADVEQLGQRYAALSETWIHTFLAARDEISPEEASERSRHFAQILDQKLEAAKSIQEKAEVRLKEQTQKLEDYLRNTHKAELNPDAIQRDLQVLLHEPELGIQRVRARLAQFDRDTWVALLGDRPDFSRDEAEALLDEVESRWTDLVHAPQAIAAEAKEQVSQHYHQAQQSIESYLRGTGKSELNPDGIKRDLQKLLDDPQQGGKAIRDRLSRMDRDTLVQLLSQRNDLSEAEVEHAIDSVQQSIQSVIQAPRYLARRAKSQVLSFEHALEDYLRNTGKDELQPDGIKRDLRILLQDPRLGSELIGDRLSHLDRSHVVALLAQRQDMTEAEASAVVEQVFAVRDQVIAQVKALDTRLKFMVDRLLANLRNYLNSLERPELNYEGIRRDLRTMFDDPQAGFDALRDRLSQFDRNTLVAIMGSSDYISQADAEKLVGQIEHSRDSVLSRAERIERRLGDRLNQMKHQAQHQYEETQRAAAAAAWWLFATALTSAISAAGAGSLAVIW